MSTAAEPDPRSGHTAVWTGAGNQMIVWGGSRWGEYNSGGTYTFGFSTDDDGDAGGTTAELEATEPPAT